MTQLSSNALNLLLCGLDAVTTRLECGVRRRHWLGRKLLALDKPVNFGLGGFELGRGSGKVGFGGHAPRLVDRLYP